MKAIFTVTFQRLDAAFVYAGSTVPVNELIGKHVWRVCVAEGDRHAVMEGTLDGSLEEITEAARALMEIRMIGKAIDANTEEPTAESSEQPGNAA
jgi:hypothetical protein